MQSVVCVTIGVWSSRFLTIIILLICTVCFVCFVFFCVNVFLVEIPPTYDDAYEPPDGDLDTSGQWYARPVPFRGPRPTDRSGSLPSDQPGVTSPTDKSGSLPHSRPPRVRSRRHYSDVTDPHRRKRYAVIRM